MLALLLALQVSVPPVSDRMALLRVWAEAVQMHRAGELDSHAERVSRLNVDAIVTINHLLPALVKVIDDERASVFVVKSGLGFSSIVVPGHELGLLRDIATRLRARGESNRFLKRAAVWHTDIGLLGRSIGEPLRQAVSLFRQALDADTQHSEARLRLGAALGRLGQHQEAVKQLRDALAETIDPPLPLQYYGHMFLGRSLEQIGALADARAVYERAAVLVPDAQAPRMALSHLLMRTGDRQAALGRIDSTLAPGAIDDFEPMGAYYLSAGREADTLMKRMDATLAPGP